MYRVMIVDDEQLTRQYIRNYITQHTVNWQVTAEAMDGSEALDLLNNQRVELVVTDIRMPIMDGLVLCDHISRTYPETKIIILSGYDEFTYAQQAMKLGVSQYLLKPIVKEELSEALERVAQMIEKKTSSNSNEAPYDNKEDEAYDRSIAAQARDYICKHYGEPISLVEVADKLGVNASYLSSLFHRTINESYIKFLTRVRMEQAVKYLKYNPNIKIYEVAERVGYISVKHFSHVFKKYCSMSPGEFQEKHNKSKEMI